MVQSRDGVALAFSCKSVQGCAPETGVPSITVSSGILKAQNKIIHVMSNNPPCCWMDAVPKITSSSNEKNDMATPYSGVFFLFQKAQYVMLQAAAQRFTPGCTLTLLLLKCF